MPSAAFWRAWSIWAVSVAVTATAVGYNAVNPLPANLAGLAGSGLNNAVGVVFVAAFATVGALLAWKRPGNPIGWLLSAIGLVYAAGTFSVLVFPHFPRTRTLADWLGWIWLLGVGLCVFVVLLFPTGHLPSRRWRPVAGAAGAGLAGWVLGCAFAPTIITAGPSMRNPAGVTGPAGDLFAIVAAGGAVLMAAAGLAAVLSLVFRYRRAGTPERAQLKWLVYAGVLVIAVALIAGGPVVWIMGPGDAANNLQNAVVSGAVALVAVAIGIAVLKYRLYDLDLVIRKTVVAAVVAAAFTAIYALAVAAAAAVTGRTGSSLVTFAAAALAAVLLQPVRARAGLLADRLVYGRRATPYEVLSEFSGRVAGAYPVEDVLPRMAAMLGEATGAERAEVWMRAGRAEQLAAAWPAPTGHPDPAAARPDARTRIVEVEHQGQRLGSLRVTPSLREPLTPAGERLVHAVAGQAGLVLRNVGLIKELRASRQRLVAAADQARRGLERDLHDGAQQQLVALRITLSLARQLVQTAPDEAAGLLAQTDQAAAAALAELRHLAHGIYPPLLADLGLGAALNAQAAKAPLPVTVEARETGRYPQQIEAALYFAVCEALQNVAKYAQASAARVTVCRDGPFLMFTVDDDGTGFDQATTPAGTGIQGMADRMAALGGTLQITSSPGHGTQVTGRIPAQDDSRDHSHTTGPLQAQGSEKRN